MFKGLNGSDEQQQFNQPSYVGAPRLTAMKRPIPGSDHDGFAYSDLIKPLSSSSLRRRE
jgi:hypothetical protein